MPESDTERECRQSIAEAACWHFERRRFVAQHVPKPLGLGWLGLLIAGICLIVVCISMILKSGNPLLLHVIPLGWGLGLICLCGGALFRMNKDLTDLHRKAKQGNRH